MTNRNTRHLPHPRRGSAILLVLVSLVLMAVLAASLLQVTRFERIPQPTSNIDPVVESVVAEIANQLTDDILDQDGNVFRVGHSGTGANFDGGGDEPWDFPWSNTAVTGNNAVRTVTLADGTTRDVYGGVMDDTWLAATAPDYRASVDADSVYDGGVMNDTIGVWRKITSLTGLYLMGTGNVADLSTGDTPIERPVDDPTKILRSDMNIPTPHPSLVDADGDGIGDSRWEWAPLRQIGSTQYVMAVRIVDLSARLDVNVASALSDSALATSTDQRLPRGDSPAELAGGQFATDFGGSQAEWMDLARHRMDGATDTAALAYDGDAQSPAVKSRREFWEDGASRVSNTLQRSDDADYDTTFGLTDAFELLYRNGLNNANQTTLEAQMPTLLRDGNAEATYTTSSTNPQKQDFWENDPRKYLSPFTGAATLAPPLTDAGQTPGGLRLDVNRAIEQDELGRIVDVIDDTLSAGGGSPFPIGDYPQFNDTRALAEQLTANLADYVDRDNQVSIVGSRAGLEALPFITEVYTQRLYNLKNVQVRDEDGDGNDDTVLTWEDEEEMNYVLEIGNPFGRWNGSGWVGRPVSLEGVYLQLNDSSNRVELSTLTGVPSDNKLDAGEVLLVYYDSGGATPAVKLDNFDSNGINGINSPSSNLTAHKASTSLTAPGGRRTHVFTLHAEEQDTNGAAGWSYSGIQVKTSDNTDFDEVLSNQTGTGYATGHKGYVVTHYQGFGQGLRMMTLNQRPQPVSNGYYVNDTSLDSPSQNSNETSGQALVEQTIETNFSNHVKINSPPIFGSLQGQQIVWHDNPRERLHWVGDILQVPLIGFDYQNTTDRDRHLSKCITDAAGGTTTLAGGIQALLLPYQAGHSAVGADSLNYPHAVLLLERLTTFNPATDGEDGDGQGDSESLAAPDYDEMLVPGKLNLNTAPQSVLESALPFPDATTRTRIAEAIIERRENNIQAQAPASGGHGMGTDGIPGIAYTSALYEQIEGLPVNPSQQVGEDIFEIGPAAYRVDLNDYEQTQGTFPTPVGSPPKSDGVADDREEQIMLAKWLSEVGSARSDVFAAYIVVQGYPANNFKAGVTESARLIVIFSRAGVRESGDRAVEIGRFRIK